MPSTFPFEYSDSFTTNTLLRTEEQLKITGNNDPEILLIARLLSGSIKLTHVATSKKILQKENYFSSDFRGYSQNWSRDFMPLLADNYSAEQFSFYIDSTRHKNRKFYKNILSELSYFFFYQKKEIHSNAFVFLYRALEHASYAFPLIYVSKTDEFSKTYSFLKELMRGNKEAGELGFFKRFIKTVYNDDPIYESSVDFPILLDTESDQNKAFNILKGLCKENMLADSTESPRVLSIKYTEVGSFIITIRNRFFHYMNGGANNIESSNIADIDRLFSLINKKCMYWFATVFLAVMSHNVLEFEKIKALINRTD